MAATTINTIASYALIVLAAADWWAAAVTWRLWRDHHDVVELRKQRTRFVITALSGTSLALAGANFLLHSPLPRGFAFSSVAVGAVLASGPCLYWLIDYYRR